MMPANIKVRLIAPVHFAQFAYFAAHDNDKKLDVIVDRLGNVIYSVNGQILQMHLDLQNRIFSVLDSNLYVV